MSGIWGLMSCLPRQEPENRHTIFFLFEDSRLIHSG